MHIDHKQFIQLLTDTSGIDSDKVESQIEELSKEIMHAVADGEAYEIEGFGIFSGIGNRVLFIPSKELETEINFKYVGMEPIEIESETPSEATTKEEKENPFEGLQTEAPKTWKRDPFAGLIDDDNSDDIGEASVDDVIIFGVESERSLDKDTQEKEEETPGPKQWGIDAHKEESNGADKLFAHLIGDDTKEKLENEAPPSDSNDTYKDIFDEEEDENNSPSLEQEEEGDLGSSLDSELMDLMSDDVETHSSESLDAGIFEEGLEDVFADSDTDNEGEEESVALEDNEIEELEEAIIEPEAKETTQEINEPEETTNEPEPEETVTLSEVDDIDLEDFDDPFDGLDEDPDDSESSEEVIPVITNISSELDSLSVEEETKTEKQKEQKPRPQKKDSQPISAWVIVLLGMVVIAGIIAGLGYFNIVNIPGISPSTQSSTAITQPVQTPPPVVPDNEVATTANETVPPAAEAEANKPEEQVSSPEVPVQVLSENVPGDQVKYGLMGILSEAANDGFTIVLYSLSVEANAFAKQKELSEEGYRALVTPISSSQYGTLWRVSIGQFASQVDAAIAGENLDSKFSDNYFIKKITN